LRKRSDREGEREGRMEGGKGPVTSTFTARHFTNAISLPDDPVTVTRSRLKLDFTVWKSPAGLMQAELSEK
jgi:hypothetical protein